MITRLKSKSGDEPNGAVKEKKQTQRKSNAGKGKTQTYSKAMQENRNSNKITKNAKQNWFNDLSKYKHIKPLAFKVRGTTSNMTNYNQLLMNSIENPNYRQKLLAIEERKLQLNNYSLPKLLNDESLKEALNHFRSGRQSRPTPILDRNPHICSSFRENKHLHAKARTIHNDDELMDDPALKIFFEVHSRQMFGLGYIDVDQEKKRVDLLTLKENVDDDQFVNEENVFRGLKLEDFSEVRKFSFEPI